MKHARVALLISLLVSTALAQFGFAQAGTWRSTITGVNLPRSAARIADAKIVSAASKSLEATAAENALNGRCRGTEVIQIAQKPNGILDKLEMGLSAQGYSLENLPGGNDTRYSLAARRGGRLIIMNVNALDGNRAVIAWCALEPVTGSVAVIVSKDAVLLGRYVCSYTLPNGSLVRAGTVTVISSSMYRWKTDRTLYQYAYDDQRLTWLTGPLSDAQTYSLTRYVPSQAGRAQFSLTERTQTGTLRWACHISN